MKIIALIPVRNEALLLPASLPCLETFCDHIFVADHRSSDDTVAVASRFAKVEVLRNNSDEMRAVIESRALLLDAFRSFEGNNFALCIDADEITPPTLFAGLRREVERVGRPGSSFSFWWVQLWRSLAFYRADASAWSNSWKPMGFLDDRRAAFPTEQNRAHEYRIPQIPDGPQAIAMEGFPVLHLQWAYWDRTQYKQAWYRVVEFIYAGFNRAQEINGKYSITLGEGEEGLAPVDPSWLKGVSIPRELWGPALNWQRDQIFSLFGQHGIARFEPLQIWHIAELREQFVREVGRKPVPDVFRPAPQPLLHRVARAVLPAPVRRAIRKSLGAVGGT